MSEYQTYFQQRFVLLKNTVK